MKYLKHFLLWSKVKVKVAHSYPTLRDLMDCVQSMEFSRLEYWRGSRFLLQGIFPTQGSNPSLLHSGRLFYHLSHQGRSRILEWVGYPFSRGSSQPRNQTPESPALQADSLPAEQYTREALLWSKLPLKNHNVHFILPVFYSSRVGRSKQAATKENDSSEEIDVFQGSSPVNDENPQEETEEEEVSTVNVCVF